MYLSTLLLPIITAYGLLFPSGFHNAKIHKAVYVENFNNNKRLSTGTGFFTEYKKSVYLVTNYHIVTGKEALSNIVKDAEGLVPNKIIIYLNNKDGNLQNITIPTQNVWKSYKILNNLHTDIAILDFGILPTITKPKDYLNHLSTKPLINNDDCYEIGFPKDYLKTKDFENGKTTNAKLITTVKGKPKEGMFAFHNAELQNGSSGSPVFNTKGEVIGIHCGALPNNKGSIIIQSQAIIDCIISGSKI